MQEPTFDGEFYIPGKSSSRMTEDINSRYAFAKPFVQNKDVLDVACGSGFGTKKLANFGAKSVVGMDISPKALTFAEKNNSHPKISYKQGDVQKIGITEAFDVIVCSETIEHITGYKDALRGFWNALRLSGTLIISTPNRPITTPSAKSMYDPIPYEFHTQEFSIKELSSLLQESGFKKISIYGNRQHIVLPTKLLRYLCKKIYEPARQSSPLYRKIRWPMQPRNILLVAEK